MKHIKIPSYLKRWVNIKKVFPLHLFDPNAPNYKINFIKDAQVHKIGGMPQLLDVCGLKLEGRHHSGIDDSKNIANVVLKMLEKGFNFH